MATVSTLPLQIVQPVLHWKANVIVYCFIMKIWRAKCENLTSDFLAWCKPPDQLMTMSLADWFSLTAPAMDAPAYFYIKHTALVQVTACKSKYAETTFGAEFMQAPFRLGFPTGHLEAFLILLHVLVQHGSKTY